MKTGKAILTIIIGLTLISCGNKSKETKLTKELEIPKSEVNNTKNKDDITFDTTSKDGFKVKIIKSKDKTEAENMTAEMVDKLVKEGYTVNHTISQYLAKDKLYVGIIYVENTKAGNEDKK